MLTLCSVLVHDDGATMVEYGIMILLIAAVCIGILVTLGGTVQGLYSSVEPAL